MVFRWSRKQEGRVPLKHFGTPLREKPVGVCQQGRRQEVTGGMKGKLRSYEGTKEQYSSKKDE